MEKPCKCILLVLKIHCARYYSIILFLRNTPSCNYYFITDLLIFTSLTRHIQWIMICLLKLSGVGQSLLLLHALIAFRFILNKSWDRQKCVSILGMDFVKCFMLLFSNMDKNCLKSDVTNVFLYPFSLVVSLHAST